METDKYKQDLKNQLKEAYGQLVYTYTACFKESYIRSCFYNCLKTFRIVLSSASTLGFFSIIISDSQTLIWITGLISVILLVYTLLFKEFEQVLQSIEHYESCSKELWIIRERYKSLITDVPYIDIEDIKSNRDTLLKETDKIYKKFKKTGKLAYRLAQKALKNNQEQYFEQDELNSILPEHLRSEKHESR